MSFASSQKVTANDIIDYMFFCKGGIAWTAVQAIPQIQLKSYCAVCIIRSTKGSVASLDVVTVQVIVSDC